MTHKHDLKRWQHSHAFGQHIKRPGESRTLVVIALTTAMMVVEIGAGVLYGSMALLADGLHMASHAAALTINAFAYVYARRNAHNERFSFGTGKVNTLGGFTGAILLAGFSLAMIWESGLRLISPVQIAFNQAIAVAVIGLIVNGVSVLILGHHEHEHDHEHEHEHEHEHGHGHESDSDDGRRLAHDDPRHEHEHKHHLDHNLIAAYLHVLADALTSLLAIFALLGAKYLGFIWADPLMGIVGAVLVARWSLGLLRSTAAVLLDREGPERIRVAVRKGIEAQDDNSVTDLHIWAVGPSIYSAIVSVVTHQPRAPDYYKALVPPGLGIVHMAVEVHRCSDDDQPHIS